MNDADILIATSPSYRVTVSDGALDRTGQTVLALCGKCRAMAVSDSTVAGLYLERCLSSLQTAGIQTEYHIIPAGERSKSPSELIGVLEHLARSGFTRTDIIVALGGGVPGDLAGLAAALYMRGIRVIQIPTTLLAMVDSSVGGKTAVDLESGKNLMGSFHQPAAVLCDPLLLRSLPEDILRDGFSEVIKYGVIADKDLFSDLEKKGGVHLDGIGSEIARCVGIKRDIVQADERDNGIRQFLNFGHTVGHAVEAMSGYTLSHGQAVAVGMAAESVLASSMLSFSQAARVAACIEAYGLSTALPYTPHEIYEATHDKKTRGDRLTLALPAEIGDCRLHTLTLSLYAEALESLL